VTQSRLRHGATECSKGGPPQANTIPACNIVNVNMNVSVIRTVFSPQRFLLADVNTKSTEGIEMVLIQGLGLVFLYCPSFIVLLITVLLITPSNCFRFCLLPTTRCLHFLACSSFTYHDQSHRELNTNTVGKLVLSSLAKMYPKEQSNTN
jgi:hypothetical protein